MARCRVWATQDPDGRVRRGPRGTNPNVRYQDLPFVTRISI